MEYDRLVFVCTLCLTLLICVLPNSLSALKKPKNSLATTASTIIKDGEWNRKCRTNTDCGSFGYICARNKSCQCAKHYIVNYKVKLCLGGIDQRCHYDEHCVENAYCMNQESCQCKDKWPIQSYDGLECSNKSPENQSVSNIFVIIFFIIKADIM